MIGHHLSPPSCTNSQFLLKITLIKEYLSQTCYERHCSKCFSWLSHALLYCDYMSLTSKETEASIGEAVHSHSSVGHRYGLSYGTSAGMIPGAPFLTSSTYLPGCLYSLVSPSTLWIWCEDLQLDTSESRHLFWRMTSVISLRHLLGAPTQSCMLDCPGFFDGQFYFQVWWLRGWSTWVSHKGGSVAPAAGMIKL